MVSLGVEALGRSKNVSRAIFDAVPAALASVFYDMDLPSGDHDHIGIQGNSPKFHDSFSPRWN
jgi:hypothetical protein